MLITCLQFMVLRGPPTRSPQRSLLPFPQSLLRIAVISGRRWDTRVSQCTEDLAGRKHVGESSFKDHDSRRMFLGGSDVSAQAGDCQHEFGEFELTYRQRDLAGTMVLKEARGLDFIGGEFFEGQDVRLESTSMQDVLKTRGHGCVQRNPHAQRIQRAQLAVFEASSAAFGCVVKALDAPAKRVCAHHLECVLERLHGVGRVEDPVQGLLPDNHRIGPLADVDHGDGQVGEQALVVLCAKAQLWSTNCQLTPGLPCCAPHSTLHTYGGFAQGLLSPQVLSQLARARERGRQAPVVRGSHGNPSMRC